MTRKDFVLIAKTIKGLPTDMRRPVAIVFAENLAGTSANFNRDRFLDACGVGE